MKRYRMHPGLRYMGSAVLLGLLWSAALMVPEVTRTVMLADSPALNVFMIVVVSVVISPVFQKPIARARAGWRFVAAAMLLPFVGAALWYLLATLVNSQTTHTGVPLWQQALVSVTMLPVVLGSVALAAYYVVIPMGLLSQYVMNRQSRGQDTDAPVRAAT